MCSWPHNQTAWSSRWIVNKYGGGGRSPIRPPAWLSLGYGRYWCLIENKALWCYAHVLRERKRKKKRMANIQKTNDSVMITSFYICSQWSGRLARQHRGRLRDRSHHQRTDGSTGFDWFVPFAPTETVSAINWWGTAACSCGQHFIPTYHQPTQSVGRGLDFASLSIRCWFIRQS